MFSIDIIRVQNATIRQFCFRPGVILKLDPGFQLDMRKRSVVLALAHALATRAQGYTHSTPIDASNISVNVSVQNSTGDVRIAAAPEEGWTTTLLLDNAMRFILRGALDQALGDVTEWEPEDDQTP